MTTLYHGSLEIIKNPRIIKSNRTLDFGEGFYTTTSKNQALSWVNLRLKNNLQHGVINIYQTVIDLAYNSNCSVLRFDVANEDWVDFVMKNRMDKEYVHHYDVVIGPVANDRVYACFNAFENGFMNKQTLISELKSYKLIDQWLFHTQKALSTLQFINAENI